MSDLELTRAQRQRLKAGDYSPLDFPIGDPPAPPCSEGDRHVIKMQPATASVSRDDGFVSRTPEHPVLYLTVTSVQRHRKGFWRVRFDVTDLRDPDVFLRRGGGDSPVDELKAGAKPPPGYTDARAKAVGEFWHLERLKRFEAGRKERGRTQGRRWAA